MGTLASDGSEFDSSRTSGKPFTFNLGQGQVIKGWDVGVATMRKGEIAKFYIRADYGYGEAGSPPKIPGGAILVFEVELLEWKSVKDILGDGGIVKNVVKDGEGWANPQEADEVTVEVTAKVQGSETPFYQSPAGGDQFYVKDGFLCKAVGEAAKKMKKGEVAKLIVKPEYGFGSEGRGAEVPADATLELEVTLLSWNKVEKVANSDLITKKILEDSKDWQRPNAGATVTVSYVARLADGTIFDEHSESEPLKYIADEEQAPCEGLDMAVLDMKKGEKALVTIAPKYAFGDAGTEAFKVPVPGGETVTYEISLIDIVKAKEVWDLSENEKMALAQEIKDKANAAFKAGKYERAIKLWRRAKQTVQHDDNFAEDNRRAAKALKFSCDLNLSAAHLKVGRPVDARRAADKILDSDSGNLKALYRRAQAYMATSDWVEAERDIRVGLQLDPENTDFKLLGRKLRAAESAADKKSKLVWAKALKAKAQEGAEKEAKASEKAATEAEA